MVRDPEIRELLRESLRLVVQAEVLADAIGHHHDRIVRVLPQLEDVIEHPPAFGEETDDTSRTRRCTDPQEDGDAGEA